MKIRPVGGELFHLAGQKHRRRNGQTDELTSRQTDEHDMTNRVVAFAILQTPYVMRDWPVPRYVA